MRKLEDGSISGAILDVFDQEPLPSDSPYWSVPNLIVTPHVSADDGRAYVAMTLSVFFDKMKDIWPANRYTIGSTLILLLTVRPDLLRF